MAESVNIEDVIGSALAALQNVLHVTAPGKVASYSEAENLVDVLPMVKRALPSADDEGKRVFEELPTLPKIPVLWPRVGDFMLRGKLVEGDTGLILFASQPWGEWLATGRLSEPLDARQHSIGYAAFLPGFFPNTSQASVAPTVPGAMMSIGEHTPNGAVIAFKPGEILAGGTGAEALAYYDPVKELASQLVSLTAALTSAGATPQTGTMLGSAFAGVKTASDAIVSSGSTTILKGK